MDARWRYLESHANEAVVQEEINREIRKGNIRVVPGRKGGIRIIPASIDPGESTTKTDVRAPKTDGPPPAWRR